MVKFEFFGNIDRTFRTSEPDALGPFAGKCFLGPLTDKVALYLCGKSERECQNFAGNVIPESVVVFDGPYAAAFGHADVEDFHNHEKTPAEPRKFGADDEVSAFGAFEEIAEPALAVRLCAADGLFNPSVNLNVLTMTESENLKSLILNGLLVAAHSNITIIHNPSSSFSRTFWPATASAEFFQN